MKKKIKNITVKWISDADFTKTIAAIMDQTNTYLYNKRSSLDSLFSDPEVVQFNTVKEVLLEYIYKVVQNNLSPYNTEKAFKNESNAHWTLMNSIALNTSTDGRIVGFVLQSLEILTKNKKISGIYHKPEKISAGSDSGNYGNYGEDYGSGRNNSYIGWILGSIAVVGSFFAYKKYKG